MVKAHFPGWRFEVIVVLCLIVIAGRAHSDDKSSDAAKAACVGYRARMTELKSFKCQFTYTRATARSVAEALDGKYGDVRKCEFLLVVDGERERYQTTSPIDITPPKRLQEEKDKNGKVTGYSSTMEFMPIQQLRKGVNSLRHSSDWRQATISGKEWIRENDLETPLSLVGWHSYGLAWLFKMSEDGFAKLSTKGILQENGRPIIHVQLINGGLEEEYFLDPERAFLPSRIQARTTSPQGQRYPDKMTRVLEAKEIGKGRWFPMHVVRVRQPATPGGPVDVVDVRVTELVVDKVKKEDLTIDLPAGTLIRWAAAQKGLGNFRLRQKEGISPDDIETLQKMLEKAPENPQMDTAVRTRSVWRRGRWYFVALGLTLFGVCGVMSYRRHRSRR